MGMSLELLRHESLKTRFDLGDVFTRRNARAVRHPKDMGVDCDRLPAKGGVEHNIGRLSADTRECLQGLATLGDLAIVVA